MRKESFSFKQFGIDDHRCGMKVGTDGVTLGAWVSCDDAGSAIDVGSGSGLIAIMLAQRGVAHIDALEIDAEACKDAIDNIASTKWQKNISLHECDFAKFSKQSGVDLIVSNPPFFANGEEAPDRQRAIARHEGELNYVSLIDFASKHLNDNGRLAFIYPFGKDDEIIYAAEMSHLKLRRICHLRQHDNRPFIRTLFEFSKNDGPIEKNILSIKTVKGDRYTPAFAELCKEFYL